MRFTINLLAMTFIVSCSNEEIPLISQDEIRLRDNNEDLKNLSLEFAENIYQPHPDIVVAVGYVLAN